MPASRNYLEEGIDPSGVECLSPQDLINLVRAAAPASDVGFIIKSAQAPNVSVHPETERFLYLDDDGFLYRYNNTGWELIKGSFSLSPTERIYIDQINPRDRSAGATSQVGKVIRVAVDTGSGQERFIFDDIATVINNSTTVEKINVNRLKPNNEDSVLLTNNGQSVWMSLSQFWNLANANIDTGIIPVNKLQGAGAAFKVISQLNPSSAPSWLTINEVIQNNSVPQKKIKHETQTITVNGDNATLDCTEHYSFKVILPIGNNIINIFLSNFPDGGSVQILIVLNGRDNTSIALSAPGLTFKWPDDTMPTIELSNEVIVSASRFGDTVYATLTTGYQ